MLVNHDIIDGNRIKPEIKLRAIVECKKGSVIKYASNILIKTVKYITIKQMDKHL